MGARWRFFNEVLPCAAGYSLCVERVVPCHSGPGPSGSFATETLPSNTTMVPGGATGTFESPPRCPWLRSRNAAERPPSWRPPATSAPCRLIAGGGPVPRRPVRGGPGSPSPQTGAGSKGLCAVPAKTGRSGPPRPVPRWRQGVEGVSTQAGRLGAPSPVTVADGLSDGRASAHSCPCTLP
jgi:hypothetical protein